MVLDLEDKLTPGLIRAAAAAGVLDRELNKLDGQSTRTSRSVSGTEREVGKLGNTAGGSSREIDRFSGRVGILGDAILTLGPAAVTMGAVAVPAVAALGSELGFAVIGAGTAVLAFHGLGTALTAFNKAAAAPTATNIAAAQTAMDKIPPSAQRFVLELHRLNPEMTKLRESAGAGLFDGLTSGIHAASKDLPLARRLLSGVSTELGTLADQAGHSLASQTWRPFLQFVGREAPQALDDLGHATGNVTHGIAGLWMAFGPMNSDISTGLVHLTADFDRWANSVGRTKGFQDFLAYVDANGPRVLDTIGQLGITLVDVGTAAAPIGGPVLDVLKSLFQIIDAIANSDFGTPLLAGIIAFRLYARAASLAGVTVNTSFKGIAAAPKQVEAGLTSLGAKTAAWSRATVADIGIVTRSWATAGAMSQREAVLQGGAMGRLKSTGAAALKGGAAAGGIAFVASGAADSLGAANTASLALMGTLAGPWGAAVGGAVGLLLDMNSASSDAGAGQKALDKVVANSTSTWSDYAAAIATAKSSSTPFGGPDSFVAPTGDDALKSVLSNPMFSLANAKADLFGKSLVEQSNEGKAAAESLDEAFSSSFTDLAAQWNSSFLSPQGGFTPSLLNQSQLGSVIERAKPAMDALHISLADIKAAYDANDGSLQPLINSIAKWTNQADSASGRSKAVSAAFAAMSDQALTADQRVQGLSDALDAMVGPMLGLGQARDAFQQGLNDMAKNLSKSSKALRGDTDAAIQNRNVIRSNVSALVDKIKKQAEAGVSTAKMTATLKQGRQAIIDEGRSAGLNAGALRHMIDVMGLTPKLIQTTLKLLGADESLSRLQAIAAQMAALRSKTITITTVHATGGHSVAGNADGGFIRGPGGPRDDVIPAWLSNGEFVVNAAATARNLSLLHSINAQHFAGGGQASSTTSTSPSGPTPAERAEAHRIADGLHHFNEALAAVTKQLDATTKSLDKAQQIRDSIAARMKQQAATVRDNFRSDFLGVANDGGIWSQGGKMQDPFSILQHDITTSRRYRRNINDLRRRGVSRGLAEQITTLEQSQQVDNLSNRRLQRLEHLFRERQRLSTGAGQADAAIVSAQRLSEANRHLANIKDEVHDTNVKIRNLNQEIARLRKEQEKNAKHTGDAVGKQINGSTAKGTRRARP